MATACDYRLNRLIRYLQSGLQVTYVVLNVAICILE